MLILEIMKILALIIFFSVLICIIIYALYTLYNKINNHIKLRKDPDFEYCKFLDKVYNINKGLYYDHKKSIIYKNYRILESPRLLRFLEKINPEFDKFDLVDEHPLTYVIYDEEDYYLNNKLTPLCDIYDFYYYDKKCQFSKKRYIYYKGKSKRINPDNYYTIINIGNGNLRSVTISYIENLFKI